MGASDRFERDWEQEVTYGITRGSTRKPLRAEARCGWQVENECVGAPCGVMDQMAVALGQQGALMALLCQPAELQPPVLIAPSVRFWGVDSGALLPHHRASSSAAAWHDAVGAPRHVIKWCVLRKGNLACWLLLAQS